MHSLVCWKLTIFYILTYEILSSLSCSTIKGKAKYTSIYKFGSYRMQSHKVWNVYWKMHGPHIYITLHPIPSKSPSLTLKSNCAFLTYIEVLKGIISQDEYLFEDLQNQISTVALAYRWWFSQYFTAVFLQCAYVVRTCRQREGKCMMFSGEGGGSVCTFLVEGVSKEILLLIVGDQLSLCTQSLLPLWSCSRPP